jgi:hypothetical protein
MQMAWMQQMYSQYLNQYMLYMHSGTVNFVQPDLGVDSVQAGLQVQRGQVSTFFFPSDFLGNIFKVFFSVFSQQRTFAFAVHHTSLLIIKGLLIKVLLYIGSLYPFRPSKEVPVLYFLLPRYIDSYF